MHTYYILIYKIIKYFKIVIDYIIDYDIIEADSRRTKMKFYEDKDKRKFVKAVNELREETNHHSDFIERWQYINLQWIWRKASNKNEAKSWMKVELGW